MKIIKLVIWGQRREISNAKQNKKTQERVEQNGIKNRGNNVLDLNPLNKSGLNNPTKIQRLT